MSLCRLSRFWGLPQVATRGTVSGFYLSVLEFAAFCTAEPGDNSLWTASYNYTAILFLKWRFTHSMGCSSTHPIFHFCSACIHNQLCRPSQNHSWNPVWRWDSQHVLCQTIQQHRHESLKKEEDIDFLQLSPTELFIILTQITNCMLQSMKNLSTPQTEPGKSWRKSCWRQRLDCFSYLYRHRGISVRVTISSPSQNRPDKKKGPPT